MKADCLKQTLPIRKATERNIHGKISLEIPGNVASYALLISIATEIVWEFFTA